MSKKLVLHIGNIDKFVYPFIEFNKENANSNNHLYYFYGFDKRLDGFPDVVQCNGKGKLRNLRKFYFYLKFLNYLIKSDIVILHSTNNKIFNFIIYMLPQKYAKKCKWIVWGGDLHNAQIYPELQKTVPEIIKRKIIPLFSSIATVSKGNFQLAMKNYGAKGRFVPCFSYPTNIPPKIESSNKINSKPNILIGNSADPINNHEEIFNRLLKDNKVSDIGNVFCPLSYGDKKYAKHIMTLGSNLFGNKFHGLTELMPIKEYHKLLSEVDIAIFNHKRPQALGNIISLLGLGKKVYVFSGTTQWDFFNSLNLDVLDVNEINLDDEIDVQKNKEIIYNYFSKENLVSQLNDLYNS
ncbi:MULTISPECIES: TDP-N-acetylfucosamine:lipid II N-acetylfucosaminyltransferase [unclassified Vibrio]|uniref:TDP-N-acetylfucosamine:lipid II N-acetylfucosaminyltransferase n=1 Tax=Vibrio sp. HB236076 TaxID=3232307 RepID=A0AB39HF94_9VIBR|nr:TDP-N-acetylfucosamine:lipid II N-acetylfucosaminyltransferase [Vibrio sp. HB161653]MDP5255399.1 TDP-N-acetylfucosamine:lipid II N-acetylfucosaminyltransferase [Vibrio sp. HB161653]